MKKIVRQASILVLCGFLALSASACAKQQGPDAGLKTEGVHDPLEGVNRGTFAVNNTLDRFVIEPVAKVYIALVPGFVRDAIQSFMHNVESPLIVGNDILQGDFKGAGVATARFIINTTAGIAGLVDVAEAQGLSYEGADFGQTLAVWGMGDGFYLVLPVLGPSTLRDTAGLAVDSFADPVRLYAQNTDENWIYYTKVGVSGLDKRARLVNAVEDLRRSSLDYYAAVRSAYAQKRAAHINKKKSGGQSAVPDYDEPKN